MTVGMDVDVVITVGTAVGVAQSQGKNRHHQGPGLGFIQLETIIDIATNITAKDSGCDCFMVAP